MLTRLDFRGLSRQEIAQRLPRPEVSGEGPTAAVREILAEVRAHGDQALLQYTERFDGVKLDALRVPSEAIEEAWANTPAELQDALVEAARRIRAFHETQRPRPHAHTDAGITVEAESRPVDRAGLYVPGGRASYPSTVLMTAIPAQVAGVAEIALCVPASQDTGQVAQITLAAAKVAGVSEIYALGGAQAVAAMAYGTESVPKVDVIAGPGNVYVAIAKQQVANEVGIAAAFAGPSEVVVVADDSTPVDYAAIDVILQAEHGPDGLAWLITWSESAGDAIDSAIDSFVAEAPRRSDISATLAKGGFLALVDTAEAAIEVANLVAPEHLELLCAAPEALVPLVKHAGAVFLGVLSPASIGDYVAGPSHVLPTNGTARFSSALTVSDFTKDVHVITVSDQGFDAVAPHVVALAAAEGLDAHAESIRIRQRARTNASSGS